MKNKKAAIAIAINKLILIVLGVFLLFGMIMIISGPLGESVGKVRILLGLEEICDETGKTAGEYKEDINEKFSQGNDKETIEIFREFHSCFPGEEFDDLLESKIETRAEQKRYTAALGYIELARELDSDFEVSDNIKDIFPERYSSELS
ncbi:hypothetical protein GF361_03850 [Candidatus Woesearchaeota archaeon]|nr:hypothetical protein [Candidatus Woesearchaeota archaeon]